MAMPAVPCLFMLMRRAARPTGIQVPQPSGFAYALSQLQMYSATQCGGQADRHHMDGRLCGIDGRFRHPIRYGHSDSQSRRRKNERKAVHDPVLHHHGYQFPLSDCVMLQNVTGLVLQNDDRTVS